MQSDRISQFLSAYVDGELNARQLCALEELLARSPEARALLEKLQADAAQLRSLPRFGAPNDLSEQILESVADRPAGAGRPYPTISERTIPPWVGLPFAAAVLTAVFCASYWYFSPPRSRPLS